LKQNLILLSLFFLCFKLSFSQERFTISGYVQEENSGENLIGVSIYDKASQKGTTSNQYGFYSITLEKGTYEIIYSFIGLNTITKKINLNENIRLNISLSEKSILSEEVIITSERQDKNIESSDMSQAKLKVENIKQLPVILGEVDVIKSAQLLPGIQSGGEGNSGLYVRGGGPDQNLILLDEAVVYNAAHLFGFFSVFNADAIKDINIIKGGMPAEYGGRLSSVLDISMKDGNNKEYEVDGGIGLLSSRLTLQGPVQKNRSSFIVSGRRTYIDVLSKPFMQKDNAFNGSGYYFYDLTTKINYRISDKNRLFLSGYFGRDVFKFINSDNDIGIKIPWGNATTSLRWNHLFNDKLFMNTSLIFSDYRFEFNLEQSQFEFKIFTGINDWNTKVDFLYQPNQRHTIKFGTNYTYHEFMPGNATGKSGEVIFEPDEVYKEYSNEGAIYLSDDIELTDAFKIHAGLRYSSFQHSGYISFRDYLKNEIEANNDNYRHLEPRLSFRYKLNSTSSLKGAYTQNYQYVHLALLSGSSLPSDLWVPSSSEIKPKFSTQYGIGYFKNLKDNMYETSIEAYYKEMTNLIEYKEGVLPEDNTNSNSDGAFTFGNGDSYGLELLIKKTKGKTTGWIGYTLSKTTRYFDEVNEGIAFPAKYDRRHDLSITAKHKLSEKWTLSSVFVYATGNAITLPTERYMVGGNIYTEYTSRNGFRMKPYHRLDIGATYTPKKKKRFQSSWSFSIYNVYSRKNPYFIYFALESAEGQEGSIQNGDLTPKAYQVSIFPILPSVTWNFNF
jgi:outer membrane receptor for ferrienterochelin and colicin|tara:strand:+ start:122 stop:2473 length:2352 start_codon:yes stop_codon:yes gene_type:complete